MDTTTFLAMVWGPIVFAVGLGIFISRDVYVRIYKDIQKEPLAGLAFGMFAMMVGIIQISVHNFWGTFREAFVSSLGWGTLLKGAIFIIYPRFVDRAAEWEVSKKLVPVAGGVTLLVGLYLIWVGFF